METQVEDGIHMAMPYDVHVIFGMLVLSGINDSRVYALNTRK